MSKTSKIIVGATLGIVLSLTGGVAFATTSFTAYDVLMPNLQQGVTTASQTKMTSNNAIARIYTIGASYKANIRTARTNGGSQYGIEKTNVGVGSYVLDTPFAAGAGVGLNIHNSTRALVNVQITGEFSAQ